MSLFVFMKDAFVARIDDIAQVALQGRNIQILFRGNANLQVYVFESVEIAKARYEEIIWVVTGGTFGTAPPGYAAAKP